jgi:hypothetical protein
MADAKSTFDALASSMAKDANPVITKMLVDMGLDSPSMFDGTQLKKDIKKITAKGIKEAFGVLLQEDFLAGLKKGSAYAALRFTSPLIVEEDPAHPSYPYAIKTADGSPSGLDIFDRSFMVYADPGTPVGDIAVVGRSGGKTSDFGQATTVKAEYRIDPSKAGSSSEQSLAEGLNKYGALSKPVSEADKPKFSKKTPATQGDFKKGKIKDLLDKKDWVIMTAENPSAKKMSDAQNASRMKLLMADLDAMGAEYTPVDGKYGNEEKSLAITGVTEKQAIKLGKKYGQESVLTNKGLVYQDGSYNPATGASELDTKPDDFYSVVNGQVFQIDIDFGEKVQPPKFSMGERRLKDKVEQTSGDVKFFQSGGDYFFSTADGFFKGIPEAGGKRISRQDYDSALSKERIKQLERGEVVRDMGNRSDSVVASDSDKTARSWMDKMVASDNAVMMKSTETASIQTLQGVAKEFGLSVDPNKAIKPALMSAVRREINRRKVSGEADKPKFSKATPGKNRVPQEHRDNLTDDGKGNYVFFHKGPKSLKGGKINPSYFGSGKSKDNRSNPVMNYYTKPDQGERMISGDVTYAVPVPKWKVYPLMSDPLDLYDKAEANFRKKFGKDQAFDAVRQADFIGPLAEKAGFDMMIAGWSVHPLRAESGKALKPDAKLTKKYEDEGVVDLTAPGAYERMMAKARGDVKFSKKTDQAFDGKKIPKTPIGDTKTVMVDGKERTVFNSNGKPIHPTVEGVQNFWKWFGESKVVDAEERPLVVYHGSDRQIDEFMQSATGELGRGMYFTKDKKEALDYAYGKRGDSQIVHEVYLKVDNPIKIKNATKDLWDKYSKKGESDDVMTRAIQAKEHDGIALTTPEFKYDIFKRKNQKTGKNREHIVVWLPNQIKSATGNYGSFDPSNPDIKFSKKTDQAFDGKKVPKTPIGDTKTVMVDGKERTVFNSKGKPIHPTVEGVENFWKWFGESKVMDKDGMSLVVTHASKKRDITAFSPEYKTELSSMGFHFGTDEQANFRTKQFDFKGDGETGQYYLSINNPLRVSHMASFAPDHLSDQMIDMGLLEDGAYEDIQSEADYNAVAVGDRLVSILEDAGYDGLVYENEREGAGDSFVPFRPNQIKSATGNYGSFDPSDPDIRFSSASPENIAKALIAKGYNTKAKAREYMVSKGADRMVDQVMAEFDKLRDAANARKAAPPKQAPQKPVGDGVKKTFAGQRVYEGSFRDEVREEVRKLGLFREVESRAEAREKAKKLIESVGIDAAVDAVRNKDMEGGAAAFVWDEALRQLDNEILESTDPTTHQELVAKQAEMVQEIGDMQLAAGRFNSAWGDILKNSDLGYYSEKKAKEWEDKFGERPSKEIMDGWRKRDEEMAEIKKKIDAAEKRAEEAQAKEAIQSIAESVIRDNNRKKSGKYSSQAKRMADQFRTLKTKPIVILDADGNPINITKLGSALPFDWNELIEVGAKAIEKTGQVADAVTAMAEKLNKQKWFSSLDDRNKMAVMSQLEDAVKGSSEGFGNERIRVPVAMIRNAVAAGIRDIDMLVNVIKEQIKDQYPDASDREIRDAITGYGKVVNMSKDEISVAIRRMKDIGRVASALEDIEKKIRPMRSGLQRDKLDAEQRALHNKLRDAMRDLPVDQAENDRVLKTALEAAKTRARNRIEDLQREIDTKERAERKQSGIVPDSELAALIKERDMLKEEHDRVFGPRVVTEEMRVKSALDSIRRSIDEYERRIADNELDPKKPTPVRETPELKIARQNLSKLRDDYKKLQDDAGVVDRRRTEAAKKATKKRIAELERRVADQDFSKKPVRKTIADDELTTLRAEKERIKEQYDADFYKEMMRNRTTGQRLGDAGWEAWGVLRAVQSTLDLSFILLQGGALTVSNMWRRPDVVASAFKNMFTAMNSEKKSEDWLRKIKAQPWYDQAKEAKLAITQPHAELTGREELFMSDWTRIAWAIAGSPLLLKSRAAHDKWVAANPFRALERGASAYLDTLRVERYLEGVKMLEARKADINGKEVTTQDYKDVADVVNTLTGRASLGALEGFSKGLTRMFYSPRMWASAIKTGTPYGLYHFGKMTPTARKMALMDMGRFFGTTMGVVTLSAIALAGDDDDETYVETDPRSSDFGKIRIGDIRIDPWGGRVQQAVAMTRMTIGGISLFMDKPIDAYKRGDKTMPLGKGFGTPTMFDVGLTMAMNKLSPSASFLVEAARTTIGKDGKRYSKYDKDPYVFKDEFNERLMPLYVGTVGDLMQEDPGALEGFLAFYGLLGGGVSVYGQKPKAKARPTSTTQGPARVPRRPE